jgi:hypothetical protein
VWLQKFLLFQHFLLVLCEDLTNDNLRRRCAVKTLSKEEQEIIFDTDSWIYSTFIAPVMTRFSFLQQVVAYCGLSL